MQIRVKENPEEFGTCGCGPVEVKYSQTTSNYFALSPKQPKKALSSAFFLDL